MLTDVIGEAAEGLPGMPTADRGAQLSACGGGALATSPGPRLLARVGLCAAPVGALDPAVTRCEKKVEPDQPC